MKVRKDNRVLTVEEADKAFYLAEGYDVVEQVEKEYKVIEKATGGKTYSIAEYSELETKNEELKAKIAELEAELEFGNAEPDRVEMKAKLTELGVEFPGNISNEKLKALYDESIKKDGE
ncbi:MAG: hypothetical protein LKF42_00410 [Streptococcaceae bacterium]|jgi:hypothetical protein|nr:hypothetical protein [Streptococcaceae bacterium]MCH4176194.1 hypothetical protein [Streptococcaceae bacterium]